MSRFLHIHSLLAIAFFVALPLGCTGSTETAQFRLAVTTSTHDSGLMDQLVPDFEQSCDCKVDVLVVGSGAALKMAEMGDVDALIAHAPELEQSFMAAGHGVRREPLMYNSFQIVGPANDPAGIADSDPLSAMEKLADARAPFVSRGDRSGTHQKELGLWRTIDVQPHWAGYVESGSGMSATLTLADETNAYALVDRGTWLRHQARLRLLPLVTEGESLRNEYSAIVANPSSPCAQSWVDYLTSARGQSLVDQYRVDGEPLFRPVSELPE